MPEADVRIQTNTVLPDAEAWLYIDLPINDVLKVMEGIEDSHVMQETLALATDYTGERIYNRKRGDWNVQLGG